MPPLADALLRGDEVALSRLATDDIKNARAEAVTILHHCAANDLSERLTEKVLKMLPGVDMNCLEGGVSALHRMAAENRLIGATTLLTYGCDVDVASTPRGETALHVASRKRHHEMTLLLLSFGASEKSKDANGKTAADVGDTHFWAQQATPIT